MEMFLIFAVCSIPNSTQKKNTLAIIGADINEAKRILVKGDLVAIPTETVYGLAGNGLNQSSLQEIFKVKNRPTFNPLILHVGRMEQVTELVQDIPSPLLRLMEHFWPGPLTVLLRKSDRVPDIVTAGSDRVAIRMPNHPLSLQLLRSLDFPVAAPSANPFTYISPTLPEHVDKMLGDQIAYILDGGACSAGLESTIVGMEEGKVKIYRYGALSVEEIQSIIKGAVLLPKETDSIQGPGQLKLHYAPHTPTLLFERETLSIEEFKNKRVGIINFAEAYPGRTQWEQRILSRSGNLKEAAAQLYQIMHEMDQMDLDLILIERLPDTELGKTMNDRLERASSK
jgi:L-threonylcarbamoyladenylate synthase